MIILGEEYTLLPQEKEKLNKKYNLAYCHFINNYTIEWFENQLKSNSHRYVVLNTTKPIPKDILTYLSNLNLKVIDLYEFCENFLEKIYIPKEIIDFKLPQIKQLSKKNYYIKRLIDIIVSSGLVILTFPAIIYSIYRIKKESPDGPILFTQKRVGKDGKEFVCYKFRSMRTDIKYFNHYTQENDPRIFPWGAFMRKTRIDELPQIINVFKGDMHLIGPRAEWNELVKKYEKVWPFYHQRHITAPGITGWAQVNYPYGRNLEDTRQKLMYDLYYIKNWSFMLEIKTIFKTVQVMLERKGL